jgi:polyketide biosynthesis acyl carrier protein
MTRAQVFDALKHNILEILPDLDSAQVDEQKTMRDLGANSIDRADIILQTTEQLGIHVKISELAQIRNIQGLVDVLCSKAGQ